MALIPAVVQQGLSAQLQAMPLPTKDKDGNPITVFMDQTHADNMANAFTTWLLDVLTNQADVINNQGVVVPVQTVPSTGTGATIVPVTGKIL